MRSGFRKRVLSGIILAPIVLYAVTAGGLPAISLLALCAGISVFEWQEISKRLPSSRVYFIAGLIYLSVCFMSMVFIRFGFADKGAFLFLSLMISIWVSDIGAYIFGKTIGGAKMAPKISPNKTWAGLFGACICCALMLLNMKFLAISLLSVEAEAVVSQYSNYVGVLCVGLLMGLVAQAGDLIISVFKRKAGVKDTGNLIPGHGGLLDRIDALLLASVFYAAVLLVVIP